MISTQQDANFYAIKVMYTEPASNCRLLIFTKYVIIEVTLSFIS